MTHPIKQHLIDPEICIRCYTCEMACPIQAITHDDNNVIVLEDKCDLCMSCIPVCPTGSIDEWRVVTEPYTAEEQFSWIELPEQQEFAETGKDIDTSIESLDDSMAILLADAHQGAGGKSRAPESATKPVINLYNLGNPATARVQGSYQLTSEGSDSEVKHIILDFDRQSFPVLEGQSIGVIPPGVDKNGNPHLPRLYSISSPRDGERPNFNNISLTVKREKDGLCSNYMCDLEMDDEIQVTGPFGSTFLMPNDPSARLIMICTGTGSAPFRAFTMRRQRAFGSTGASMVLFFGARTPESLPYFGPLKKIPDSILVKHMAFSRIPDSPKQYVQDRLLLEESAIAEMLSDPNTYIYICGLRGMEEGVEDTLTTISNSVGINWQEKKDAMRKDGHYHVETY